MASGSRNSRQTNTKGEQMLTKSTRTWMDDQRQDHIDPKGPKQRNHSKLLQTHNLPTDDVENINSTDKRIDLQLANKLQIVSWGTERMLQRIQRHSRVTLHRSAHAKWESKTRRKNLAITWIDYKKAYDLVPQSWLINCFKMYKISHEVINFSEKTMKPWKEKLTVGWRSLAEANIQRGTFQVNTLSPLLFITAVMPLNHILRKCTAVYKLSKLQEKINHLMYMDDIKLFAKNEKELETLINAVRIYSQDIRMEFGIEKGTLLRKSGKRHLTDGIEPPN